MKKLKLILVAIILIILMILFANVVNSSSGELPLGSIGAQVYDKSTGNYCYKISANTLANYNNFYCVEHGAWMPAYARWMYVASTVQINGNVATINGSVQCEGDYNNLLGAILCEGELGWGTSQNNYHDSQVGLYYYWNDWLSEVRAATGSRHGMESCSSNESISSKYNASELFNWYQSLASQNAYNVTIYFMKVNASPHVQNLIIVERGPKEELDIDIPVEKVWHDGENKFNTRKDITVELLANGASTGKKITLNKSNNWKGEFSDLDIKDGNGREIKYTIKEIDAPLGYTTKTSGNMKNGYTITNTLLTEVKVVKQWDDKDDLDEYRPSSLKVMLYSNGVSTGKTVTLDANNNWTAIFEKLHKYDGNGKEINYSVQEESIAKYESPVYNKTEDSKNGYITVTITNKHVPYYDGYIEITGKVWSDNPDGKSNNINGIFDNDKDSLLEGITVRLKYIDENGKHQLFNPNLPNIYETKTNSKGEYKIVVNYDNSKNVYKLFEDINTVNKKLETAYVEFEYDGMKYTTVNDEITTRKIVDANGKESIVNVPSSEQSKAVENETSRNNFDAAHSTIKPDTAHPDNWKDKNITASTKTVTSYEKGQSEEKEVVVKYCNGNGTCDRTNPEGAWMIIENQPNKYPCENCKGTGHDMRTYNITVQKIPNINLGLFVREQPDVAIFSDLSKVEVTMNNQKYTYLYGVRTSETEEDAKKSYEQAYQEAINKGMSHDEAERYAKQLEIQVKFQNKGTYTYKRPVNPADIAYIQEEANQNAMSVLVTYEVKLANLSTTLPITVHSIINSFDSEYTLNTAGWSVTDVAGFKQATNANLNITVEPQKESDAIELTYTVSMDAIRGLLREQATLNNAVEIGAYSTTYGAKTLYAEQRSGGRTGKPYGGYDYNSHPGNAGIFINNEGRLEAAKPEDDTDIAPSFVLCKDEEQRVLSGTIWEDGDIDNGSGPENFRLGDGKKSESEKTVGNAKIELYKVNNDGTTTLATLYKVNPDNGEISTKPAVAYSTSDGYYSFGSEAEGYSVVTDTYLMKFTYGKGISTETGTISSSINDVSISARDYKSTIISSGTELYNVFKGTSNSDEWHLKLDKGYSVAVDEMDQRIAIEDLQYSNFDNAINITAYSKPFKMQVEFDPSKTSSVGADGKTTFGNELSVFDFGIIERAREDLYAQKTITNFKITLSNGQILAEGNPSDTSSNINYTKTMGFRQEVSNGEQARKALEKQVLMEIDAELIQGAHMEAKYAINVVNNSEKDYDYYVDGNIKTEYYYFGTNNVDNSPIIKSSVNCIVDYVDSDMEYTWENADKWAKVTSDDLGREGHQLANNRTIKLIKDGEYVAYASTIYSELAPGETSTTQYATARKSLANDDENVFENHVEILQIDAKTARTMEGKDENGTPINKQSKPGNYVPSSAARFTDNNVNNSEEGKHEQDDDMVKIIITPPTGITNYIMTYLFEILIGLIIMVGAVIFIKKKVLTNNILK